MSVVQDSAVSIVAVIDRANSDMNLGNFRRFLGQYHCRISSTSDVADASLTLMTTVIKFPNKSVLNGKVNGKRKPRRFSSIHLPFDHRANEVCRLSIFVYEETYGSQPYAKGLNRLAHLF
jgi:hypothetical protein